MKQILLSALIVLSFGYAGAQQREQYSRARVLLDNKGHDIRSLAATGIATDHGEYRKNVFFTSDFSAREINDIKHAGFTVEILIDDVVKHYREQNVLPSQPQQKSTGIPCDTTAVPLVPVPAHFHLGTYGGYFTYTEMLAILDSMTLLYPNLISARQAIDTFHSIEGRQIYWLRISNNPAVLQPAKPQILYTALHHAREPESLSATIFYMWYLLEHYNTDPQVKAIVDNTEMYFIPCVNPDGYLYNISTDPTGGGMWRKNRRNNLDATFGVDLNRNYGTMWGYDNVGSSNVTNSDTYRGTAAFSEPETRAVKWFSEQYDFKICMNYHTYNNDILYPWSYIPDLLTVDSNQLTAYGSFLTKYNFYHYGTCNQTLGYLANGDSDDWMYGEQVTKNKILAFTPEIGAPDEGFYPPASKIIPNSKANLLANVNVASLLLPYTSITNTQSAVLMTQSGFLHYKLQRLGIPDIGTFTLTMQSLDNHLNISATPKVYTNPTMLQQFNDSISYTVNANTQNGQLLRYVIKVNNGYYNITDTVQVNYGAIANTTVVPMNVGPDWVSNGWNVCTGVYYTPPSSIKSGPCGVNYPDTSDFTITTVQPIDLTNKRNAYLEFHTRWNVENLYDYVQVKASQYQANNWIPLCGRYTKTGGQYQATGEPLYDGLHPDWVLEQMDLNDFIGQQISIRFEMVSDQATNFEGYYFDDLKVITVKDTDLNATNISLQNEMKISPNPASDRVTVSLPGISNTDNVTAILYDCYGRKLNFFILDAPQTSIDVSHLPTGIYYLEISGGNYAGSVHKVSVLR